jgi:hypothetical protein
MRTTLAARPVTSAVVIAAPAAAQVWGNTQVGPDGPGSDRDVEQGVARHRGPAGIGLRF